MSENMRILIVEDEPIIADDLVFMLEEMGYLNVDTVYSANEALALLDKNNFDLVLLDINLDGEKDGIDIAEFLHKEGKAPFIFLTSLSDDKTIERVKKTNPSAYLVKPIDEKDLRVNIELSFSKFNERPQNANSY